VVRYLVKNRDFTFMGDRLIAKPLPTKNSTTQKHGLMSTFGLEQASNPRYQCSSGSRPYAPWGIHYTINKLYLRREDILNVKTNVTWETELTSWVLNYEFVKRASYWHQETCNFTEWRIPATDVTVACCNDTLPAFQNRGGPTFLYVAYWSIQTLSQIGMMLHQHFGADFPVKNIWHKESFKLQLWDLIIKYFLINTSNCAE
jgi:hypothetical protein